MTENRTDCENTVSCRMNDVRICQHQASIKHAAHRPLSLSFIGSEMKHVMIEYVCLNVSLSDTATSAEYLTPESTICVSPISHTMATVEILNVCDFKHASTLLVMM